MSPVLQSKLLRVLQEKTFERVGGNDILKADVRVIAATHRNLEKMFSDGEFRAELYYRLNGFSIHLPPLRERGTDLESLVEHFRRRTARYQRPNDAAPSKGTGTVAPYQKASSWHGCCISYDDAVRRLPKLTTQFHISFC